MKAVVMAGGFGTRLRPLTSNIPKPMAPVATKPMMEHIIRLLKKNGISNIICLLYFQPSVITDYFGDGSHWGVKIQYVYSEADFGTAGSVKNAEHLLGEPFIIISGDVLTDFDLTQIIQFHQRKKSEATIALTRHPNPLQFGVVMTEEDGRISRFLEKPAWGQVFSDTINTGIYVLEPHVLSRIPPKEEFDFSKDLFPAMLKGGAPLYGCVAEGYWRDIGNLSEYLQGNMDFLEGKIQLLDEHFVLENGVWKSPTARIHPGAQVIAPAVIGANTQIEEGAVVEKSIIGENCRIGEGARLTDVVLWNAVEVGRFSRLQKDVVGYRTRIGDSVFVAENVFISDDVVVGSGATLKANIKIWPNKEVENGAVVTASLVLGEHWLRELFSNSKVAGLVNSEVTPEFATKLGAAIGASLGMDKTVMVARDSSTASRMINRAIITGLMSTGIHVFDLRSVPIPIVRHQLKANSASGGVITRLSARQKNTIEIILLDQDGRDLPVNKCKTIERLFFGEDFFRAPINKIGQLNFPIRVTEQYQSNFLNALKQEDIRKAKFRIVIDFSFGGASTILPGILGRLETDVIALNAYLEGLLIKPETETQSRALGQLRSIVTSLDTEMGILLNTSAEKIQLVDETGRVFNNHQLALAVTSLALQSYGFNRIATPVDASVQMEELCRKHDCELIYTNSTHRGMMDAVLNQAAQFVAGSRGGFIFADFHFACDGMFSIAKLLEMLAISGKSLSQVYDSLPSVHILRKEIPCPWHKKGQVMRQIMNHTRGKRRLLIDGVRFQMPEGHVLLMPDDDKAYFHLQVESDHREKAALLLQKYSELLSEWKK